MINALAFIRDDRNIITYRPRWNSVTGSVNATILLQQIIYRWRGKPFYKFSDVCVHPDYRPGDSWREELGMGRYEFYNARSQIASKTSRNTMNEETLVSYWVDGYRRTWYILNETLLIQKLQHIYPMPQQSEEKPARVRDGLNHILDWMKFTGRMTDKDSMASPEQILAWALWVKLNKNLLKQGKNPVAIARASWRKGDWPGQELSDLARREIEVVLTADVPELELDALVEEYKRPSAIPDALKEIVKR